MEDKPRTDLWQAKDKKKDLQIAATEGECNFTDFFNEINKYYRLF